MEARSRKALTAVIAAPLVAAVAGAALWSARRVRMSGAEEISGKGRAFLASARGLYAGPAEESLAAVLPRERAEGDAGAVYVAAFLDGKGAPRELPARPRAAVPGLGIDADAALGALEHPSIAGVMRGARMARCSLVEGGLGLADDYHSSRTLPLDLCARAGAILVAAAPALEARGGPEAARGALRAAAGLGWHLTRDVRLDHFICGSEMLVSASTALSKSYEARGDPKTAAAAKRVEVVAQGWVLNASGTALAFRQAGVTADGAEFLAAEVDRVEVPCWRAEGIYSLGSGWCYNLYERKRGPAAVRRAKLDELGAPADPGEAAVLAIARKALDADAQSLVETVGEAIRYARPRRGR